MSLNWKEIDCILQELDLVGMSVLQIFQNDYHNLYLQLRSPKAKYILRFCLQSGSVRFHKVVERPRSQGKQPRFSEFLRSRIRGARIVSVSQIACERIVAMKLLRGEIETIIYFKLWGSAANIIVCDSSNRILELAYRRPARGEIAGKIFALPEISAQSKTLDALNLRPLPEGVSFADGIAEWYKNKELKTEQDNLHKKLHQYCTRNKQSLLKRLQKREEFDKKSAEQYQNQADIILSNVHQIQQGETMFEDIESGMVISLDPSYSPVKNAEALYAKASRIRAKHERSMVDRSQLESELAETEMILAELDNNPSIGELTNLARKVSFDLTKQGEHIHRQSRAVLDKVGRKNAVAQKKITGLQFTSQNFRILLGRSSEENLKLLRKHTRGNDTWLHVRDYTGSYVFIKQEGNRTIPLDVLLDAAYLAVYYSKARSKGQADVYYTQVKYLKLVKNSKPGLVIPTQEKNLHVKIDDSRLRKILDRAKELKYENNL